AEHRVILAVLALMGAAVGHLEAPVELVRAELRGILHDHEIWEEHILYPSLDRLLDDREADDLVKRIQAWREMCADDTSHRHGPPEPAASGEFPSPRAAGGEREARRGGHPSPQAPPPPLLKQPLNQPPPTPALP